LKAYIELASIPASKSGQTKTNIQMPSKMREIGGRRSDPNARCFCPVPTATIRLDPSPQPSYEDQPCVRRFHDTYDNAATGVNVPKILKCHGTDGRTYDQLCKLDETRLDPITVRVRVRVRVRVS